MMRCNDDLVQLYVDGTLHSTEAALVEAHLKGCAPCRRRAGFYKGLCWDLAQSERLAPVLAEEPAELAALLQAEWRHNQKPAASRATSLELSTLWLTANPAVTGPVRLAGEIGHAGWEGLRHLGLARIRQAGRSALAKLLRRKGGDGR